MKEIYGTAQNNMISEALEDIWKRGRSRQEIDKEVCGKKDGTREFFLLCPK
jgi:hypothetical protein